MKLSRLFVVVVCFMVAASLLFAFSSSLAVVSAHSQSDEPEQNSEKIISISINGDINDQTFIVTITNSQEVFTAEITTVFNMGLVSSAELQYTSNVTGFYQITVAPPIGWESNGGTCSYIDGSIVILPSPEEGFEFPDVKNISCNFSLKEIIDPTKGLILFDMFTTDSDGLFDFSLSSTETISNYSIFTHRQTGKLQVQLPPGTYYFDEAYSADWQLIFSSCQPPGFNSESFDPHDGFQVEAGSFHSCKLRNMPTYDFNNIPLQIKKQSAPVGGEFSFVQTNTTPSFGTDVQTFSISTGFELVNYFSRVMSGTVDLSILPDDDWSLSHFFCQSLSPSGTTFTDVTFPLNAKNGWEYTCWVGHVSNKFVEISIIKQGDPLFDSEFNFVITNSDTLNNEITNSITITTNDGFGYEKYISDVGFLQISENEKEDWFLDSANCTASSASNTINLGDPSQGFEIEKGWDVTCRFINARDITANGIPIVLFQTTDYFDDIFTVTLTNSDTAEGDSVGTYSLTTDGGDASQTVFVYPGFVKFAVESQREWVMLHSRCYAEVPNSATELELGDPFDGFYVEEGWTVKCSQLNVTPSSGRGTLIVNKTTGPINDGEFTFVLSNGSEAFSSTMRTINNFGTLSIEDLSPGSYQLTEVESPDWILAGSGCQGEDPLGRPFGLPGAEEGLMILGGWTVTCSFENQQVFDPNMGIIYLSKNVADNKRDGTFLFDLHSTTQSETISVTTYSSFNDIQIQVPPGVYSVTEQIQSGWTLLSSECRGNSDGQGGFFDGEAGDTFSISAGGQINCHFVNQLDDPSAVEIRGINSAEKSLLPLLITLFLVLILTAGILSRQKAHLI